MSRHTIAWLVPLVMFGTAKAAADTFSGWRYRAPPDYTTETSTDHVALTKLDGATFCSIASRFTRSVVSTRSIVWHG